MDVGLAHIYAIKIMLAGARDLHRRQHLCRAKNAEQSITEPQPPPQSLFAPSTPMRKLIARGVSRGKAIKRFAYCEDNLHTRLLCIDIGLAGTRGMTKINSQIALTLPIAAEEN
jgi:hypothetical protein